MIASHNLREWAANLRASGTHAELSDELLELIEDHDAGENWLELIAGACDDIDDGGDPDRNTVDHARDRLRALDGLTGVCRDLGGFDPLTGTLESDDGTTGTGKERLAEMIRAAQGYSQMRDAMLKYGAIQKSADPQRVVATFKALMG